jgi:hypothetical protein
MIYWTLSAQEEMVYRAQRVLFDTFAHQSSRTPSANLHLLRDSISTTRLFLEISINDSNHTQKTNLYFPVALEKA